MIIHNNYDTTIKNFTIYGERHSGTKFLKRTIEKSFSIPVVWDFGWKHFFGHYDNLIKNNGQNTLFFGIVRNPYDWIMAMHKHAYHVPHFISKDFDCLVSSEWLSVNAQGKEKTDQFGNYEDRNYVNGKKFNNIFELRKTKNNYLYHNMPKLCQNYCLINYETLVSNYQNLLTNISNLFNIKFNNKICKVNAPTEYKLTKHQKTIINNNIEWSIENKLNYYVDNKI
jgi:hypothetical protein